MPSTKQAVQAVFYRTEAGGCSAQRVGTTSTSFTSGNLRTARPDSAIFDDTSETSLVLAMAGSEKADWVAG